MRKILVSCVVASLSVTALAQVDTTKLHNIQEVVVTGTRNVTDVRHLPMTLTVVGRDKLVENDRQNILPTLAEQVPSMFVTSRGMMGYGVSNGAAGGITMRGLSSGSGQFMVLIDGHPQYNGLYGHSISDSYQTMMTEHVEVLRGPASVLYGSNAMGGVINIVTRGMKTNGIRTDLNIGAGSYGTFQADASNQFKSGKFSSTLAAQYGRSDNHRPRMGFEQYGGYAKVGYELSKNWNASANVDVTHFNSSYPGSVSVPMYEADQWITRGVATLAIDNNYGNTSGGLSVYYNFGRHKINDGYKEGAQPQIDYFRSKDALAGFSLYQSATFFSGNRITVGVDYQHIYGYAYYTLRETGEVNTAGRRAMQSGKANMNEWAGYVDFRQDINSWLTVDAGLRLDNHSVSGTEWIPQAGVVVRPIETGELKAMFSKGFRNPTTKEMYLYGSANDELKPERTFNYELSWKQRFYSFNYGVNLFYIKGDNLIQTVANKNINTGEIENYGLELEASWRINSHWSLNSNHSFLHMEKHILSSPEYKGYVGANCRYGKWSVSAGLQQLVGLFTSVGETDKKENATLLNTTINYKALNWLSLWAKGDNLLAQKYEFIEGYPMPRATFMGGVRITL